MRDLMVFGFFCATLFLCVRKTYAAYLVWGWAGIIALDIFLYGFMRGIPFVQIFAIITLILLLLRVDSEQVEFKSNRTSVLLFIFAAHGFLVALLAEPGLSRNWELYTNLMKTFLFCLVMPMLVTSRFRIHALVLMLVFAIAFHGALDGLKFLASGGGHNARGNAKLGDNNHFALIIIFALPLLLYLHQYTARFWVRWGIVGTFLITTLAVVATSSRGGLISMGALAIWVVMRSKQKLTGLFVIGMSAFLILQLAPESWTAKMDTIGQANEDSSFMGRVTAWKRASAIAVDHPVFGGGFHAGQAPSLFEDYRYKQGILGFVETPDVNYPAASHSIYFEVLGDLGFLGLFLFLALIVNAFVTGSEINKLAKSQGPPSAWMGDLSSMLMGALVVYVVGGALLSAAYFDFPYIAMMLLEVLKQMALKARIDQGVNE